MSDIAPIGRPSAATLSSQTRPGRPQPASTSPARADDQVEFSTTARLLSKIAELPEIRQELVDQVRAEIAAGTYETEDKVDAALQSLLSDLDVEQA